MSESTTSEVAMISGVPEELASTYPQVAITSPLAGSTVSGTVTIYYWVLDPNDNFQKFELYVDGTLYQTIKVAKHNKTLNFAWQTTAFVNGSHSLMVKDYSASGVGASAPVTVTVSN